MALRVEATADQVSLLVIANRSRSRRCFAGLRFTVGKPVKVNRGYPYKGMANLFVRLQYRL